MSNDETILVLDSEDEDDHVFVIEPTDGGANENVDPRPSGKRLNSSEINPKDIYNKYLKLDQDCSLIATTEGFTCSICLDQIVEGNGVLLKSCIHQFCRTCLQSFVRLSEEAQIVCPYSDANYSCTAHLQEREIRALLSKAEHDRYLARSLQKAEMIGGSSMFHCKTLNCEGFCEFELEVKFFDCFICHKRNCISCQAIHVDMSCEQFQDRDKPAAQLEEEATEREIKSQLQRGDAKNCPKCNLLIQKNGGCDHMRCTNCGTAFGWTKGKVVKERRSAAANIRIANEEQASRSLEPMANVMYYQAALARHMREMDHDQARLLTMPPVPYARRMRRRDAEIYPGRHAARMYRTTDLQRANRSHRSEILQNLLQYTSERNDNNLPVANTIPNNDVTNILLPPQPQPQPQPQPDFSLPLNLRMRPDANNLNPRNIQPVAPRPRSEIAMSSPLRTLNTCALHSRPPFNTTQATYQGTNQNVNQMRIPAAWGFSASFDTDPMIPHAHNNNVSTAQQLPDLGHIVGSVRLTNLLATGGVTSTPSLTERDTLYGVQYSPFPDRFM